MSVFLWCKVFSSCCKVLICNNLLPRSKKAHSVTMFANRTRREVCLEFGTSSPQMIWRIRTTCPGLLLGAKGSPSSSPLLPSRLSITSQTPVSVIYLSTVQYIITILNSSILLAPYFFIYMFVNVFRIILPYYLVLFWTNYIILVYLRMGKLFFLTKIICWLQQDDTVYIDTTWITMWHFYYLSCYSYFYLVSLVRPKSYAV